MIHDQHFTTLQKMTRVSKRLEDWVSWSHETLEGLTFVVGSGAAEDVMPRSMFTEIATEETERFENGKGFKRPEGEAH